MRKHFSFAALMSIVTGRLLSTLDEQTELLRHLTGSGALAGDFDGERHYQAARQVLYKQFPMFANGDMQFAVGKIIETLNTPLGKHEPEPLILGWLSKQAVRLNMDITQPVEVEGGKESSVIEGTKKDLLDQMMIKMGFSARFDGILFGFKKEYEELPTVLGLIEKHEGGFRTDFLQKTREFLDKEFTEEELQKLSEIYDSPLIQRVINFQKPGSYLEICVEITKAFTEAIEAELED